VFPWNRRCSLDIEGFLLLQNVFFYYRTCCLLQNVFSYWRRCSLPTEDVLWLQNVFSWADSSIASRPPVSLGATLTARVRIDFFITSCLMYSYKWAFYVCLYVGLICVLICTHPRAYWFLYYMLPSVFVHETLYVCLYVTTRVRYDIENDQNQNARVFISLI